MKKLTQCEYEKNFDLEHRIQAAGVPIVKGAQDEAPDLLVRQNFEAYDSILFEYSGGIGIALPLKVVSNMNVFVFSAVDIHLDRLPNAHFWLLDERGKDGWPDYYFYDRPEMRFDRKETINHLVKEQVRLYRGIPIQGLLLASWLDHVPADILSGQILDGSITIIDQFEHQYHVRIRLRVDGKIGESAARNSLNLKTRRRLLDQPDVPGKVQIVK